MKKKYLYILLLGNISPIFGQIGVGTQFPHESAILELNSTNKGLLLPKAEIQSINDITTIPNPKNGLLIYNTRKSNLATDNVDANTIYVNINSKWMRYIDITEISKLKAFSEYVLTSNQNDLLTTSELTTINTESIIPLRWVNPQEVITDSNNVELSGQELIIKTSGAYRVSAMIDYNPYLSTSLSKTHLTLTLQKSENNGLTWISLIGSTLPYEEGVTNHSQTIILPMNIKTFTANTKLRLVISKPLINADNHSTGAGFRTSTNDIVKSIRISKILGN